MANRFPLIINTTSGQIAEIPTADNLDLSGCGIYNGTATITLPTASGTLSTIAGTETLTNKTINLANNTLTMTSAQLAAALTDETGSGANVFATSPTLVTPNIGAATGTSLSVSGSLTSTVATGTAPLVVTSTTVVANLNADLWDGNHFSSYLNQAVLTTSNVQHASLGIGTAASGTAGEIRATNAITSYYSDDRLKTRTGNIQNALDKVLSLDGFHYHANETAVALGYDASKEEVGLSAQQVQAVLPEVIAPAPIDPQYMTVHYERLVPLLVEAIKEQQKQIEELKSMIQG